jgi:hypothetical protein
MDDRDTEHLLRQEGAAYSPSNATPFGVKRLSFHALDELRERSFESFTTSAPCVKSAKSFPFTLRPFDPNLQSRGG